MTAPRAGTPSSLTPMPGTSRATVRLQQMARFRNLLVHVYWQVDYGRVFDVLEHDLTDLRAFSETIAALL